MKTIYDSLVSLSHGSDSAGGWGDWGAYWNRIRSAGEWTPSGDASETDVASGKTFYSDDRTQKTGTATLAPDYSKQSRAIWDDYNNDSSPDGDNAGEESMWTNTSGNNSSGVWKDTLTGLYWSPFIGNNTNNFTVSTCGFFLSDDRGESGGGDTCGDAINTCAALSLDSDSNEVGGSSDAESDWYLPSHKEMMQSYIDGFYNQTNSVFATTYRYWTSSESTGYPTYAHSYNANNAGTGNGFLKSSLRAVRCVRRD